MVGTAVDAAAGKRQAAARNPADKVACTAEGLPRNSGLDDRANRTAARVGVARVGVALVGGALVGEER